MRRSILQISFILILGICSEAQQSAPENFRKGKFFASWGWNWGAYSKSDIHFTGADHNFVIKDVVAVDRPSRFSLEKYFNFNQFSIPQYNFRMGYFIRDNYSVSIAWDHMKYMMRPLQTVKISGEIDAGTAFDGQYANDDILLVEEFLQFEHTDGFNSLNVEIRRYDEFFQRGVFKLELVEGVGIGALVPRTDAVLFNRLNADKFHFSGHEIHAMLGARVNIGKRFFTQSEIKAGYANMQDILTTTADTDRASQKFFFYQLNVIFGATINFNKKK